jgi:hypothetical protein
MTLAAREGWFRSLEAVMIKTLVAGAVAAVFALPVTASAANDSIVVAEGGGGGGADGPAQRPARSANGAASRSGNFDRLDRNGDGYVSRDEAKDAAELQTRFSELDANNDGKLSREEYDALNRSASGASASGRTSGNGAEPRQPGRSPAPGKGGGDASTSGSNTK